MNERDALDSERRTPAVIGKRAEEFARDVGAIYACAHVLDDDDELVVYTVVNNAVWVSTNGQDRKLAREAD